MKPEVLTGGERSIAPVTINGKPPYFDRDRVLTLSGTRLTDGDAKLLRAFLDELRISRSRAALRALETEER